MNSKLKVIFFVGLTLAFVILDYVNSKTIYPGQEPTLAIFSSERIYGGHCSFEVKE